MRTKVILREDVENLGDAGELVSVRRGYARNYLIPQGKAIPATASSLRELEHHRRVIQEKQARERRSLDAQRAHIETLEVEITAQAGEEGKLFGSVTSREIAEHLAGKGIEIDRRKIVLDEPIKQVGEHSVNVRLHREVVASLKVKVVAAS